MILNTTDNSVREVAERGVAVDNGEAEDGAKSEDQLPKTSSRSSAVAVTTSASASAHAIGIDNDSLVKSILYPALSLSNILHFNVQIMVGKDEPEDKIINRFKKEVLKASVLQECKHTRFFENKHDKIKRKAHEASRRNRKRKPQSRAWAKNKHGSIKKKKDAANDDIDDWELPHVDIPYT
ncbi:30S ribosomal protein S21, chloroplastic [Glycine max]|nr:30S ribosomal protein S21, chloroplastic [Glycine max]